MSEHKPPTATSCAVSSSGVRSAWGVRRSATSTQTKPGPRAAKRSSSPTTDPGTCDLLLRGRRLLASWRGLLRSEPRWPRHVGRLHLDNGASVYAFLRPLLFLGLRLRPASFV